MDQTPTPQQPSGLQTVEQLIGAVEDIVSATKSGTGGNLLANVLPAAGVILSVLLTWLSHAEAQFPQNHGLLVAGAVVTFLVAVLSALGAAHSDKSVVSAAVGMLQAFHASTTVASVAGTASKALQAAGPIPNTEPREAVALPDGTKVVVTGQAGIDALKQHVTDIVNQQTRAIAAAIPSQVVTLPNGPAVTVLGQAGIDALKEHVAAVTPLLAAVEKAKTDAKPA